jgi:hypothetical protein
MVIQQLQTVKAFLEQSPPNVELALRELDIAMQVIAQASRNENQRLIELEFDLPIRANDALLKEFGW